MAPEVKAGEGPVEQRGASRGSKWGNGLEQRSGERHQARHRGQSGQSKVAYLSRSKIF